MLKVEKIDKKVSGDVAYPYIDKLITSISEDFKAEVRYFRRDIIKSFEAHFHALTEKLNSQKSMLNKHDKELKKHSRILENHCETLTSLTKDMNEVKREKPKRILSKFWIIAIIIYIIFNVSLFGAMINLMLKILSKVN